MSLFNLERFVWFKKKKTKKLKDSYKQFSSLGFCIIKHKPCLFPCLLDGKG